MKQHQISTILALIFSLQVAHAANYSFLKNAPIADFNEDDVAIMEENLYKSLDKLEDGKKSAWKNDKTGNAGLAQPVKTYDKAGKTCRSLRLVNRSKKSLNESVYDFCKEESGWKLSM